MIATLEKKTKAYAARKDRSARDQAEMSRLGRDIGEIPPTANVQRCRQGRDSFEFFARTYFAKTFYLNWSPDHRKIIAKIETAVRDGGLFAMAMPRGSGKTSLAEVAAIWAILYGFRRFPFIVGSEETSALEILQSIKSELQNNQMLLEDFPEACLPIRALEGVSLRAKGQLYKGVRTQLEWRTNEIVLATIPGAVCSGAVLRVAGITGRVRGAKFKRPDGANERPDLVLVDDPQTDESAKSLTQCEERLRVLTKAVLGLAGPGKKISGVMPLTVIHQGDVADQILDRNKHPEWNGERTKLVYKFPTDEAKWEQYRKLRADGFRAGNVGKEATDFYAANQAAMDAGSETAWAERKKPNEVSAIQHAMNLRYDLGEEAFFSEYQNDPISQRETVSNILKAEQIMEKISHRPRGEIPAECSKLVAFIDVHKEALYWGVGAFEDGYSGTIIDYGTFPDQHRHHFRLNDIRRTLSSLLKSQSMEESIRGGLDALTADLLSREYKRDDGAVMKITRCPVDAQWGESRDVVYKFCRESPHSEVVIPSHGLFYGASSNPFGEYKRKRGDRIGHHWRVTITGEAVAQRRIQFDANYFKLFLHQRFAVPIGGRGCLTLFGDSPQDHLMFSEHCAAEDADLVSSKGRTVLEFKHNNKNRDNHFFDVGVGLLVAASECGISLKESSTPQPGKRKRVDFGELQRQQQAA
jgi:hypothetical protein